MKLLVNQPRIKNMTAILLLLMMALLFMHHGLEDKTMLGGLFSDQYYYKLSYYGLPSATYFEKGYMFITEICRKAGLSYMMFKGIAFSIAVILVATSIGVYDANYPFALLLYFISAFQADLEQTRNFFAVSIVIFAIRFLHKSQQSVLNATKYTILIILSATIHSSMLFFIIFLVLYIKNNKLFLDLLFPTILTLCIIVKIEPKTLIFIGNILYEITKIERMKLWATFLSGRGFYVCVVLHGYMLFIMNKQMRLLQNVNLDTGLKKDYEFVETMYRCLQLLSCAIPLYLFSTEFLRLFRSLFIVYFVAILVGAKILDKTRALNDHRIKYEIAITLFVAAYIAVFNPMGITYAYYKAI